MLFLLPMLALVLIASGGVWRYGYLQHLQQLSQRGMAEVALVLDGLASELQRYRDKAVLLAEHPALTPLARGAGRTARADALLLTAADRTGAAAIYFVAPDGQVLAGSHDTPPHDLQKTDYFRRATNGALGAGHGTDPESGRRLFMFAAPSFDATGKIQAVLLVEADAENIEIGWRGGSTAILLLDDSNRIFMSNRSELLGWTHPPGESSLVHGDGREVQFRQSDIGPHEIWHLDLGPYLPGTALRLTRTRPHIGMTGEALVDTAPARQIAWLQAGAVGTALLLLGTLLHVVQERRRTLARANADLEKRVAERTTTLTRTNEALRREIHERQEAEAALKRAQADLVQAGKLSALGQLSAGISHELNQPLMAIQQFTTNARAFQDRGEPGKTAENLGRIEDMAHRMSRIIRNLRAFVRNENEPMSRVDIVRVINAALELTEAKLRQEGVTVQWTPPQSPVLVHGGEVRLEQVLVNLVTNAADAMQDSAEKHLEITVEPRAPVIVRVRDTGPGIESPERIFDPVYSTKQVGSSEGMGLGLSISYGLVQSFGGNIRGANTGSGAEFSVELEPWTRDSAA